MARKTAGRKAGKAASQRRARRQAREAGRDDRSDYRNVRRAQKIEAASKKGCLPKLGMLLLPFIAAGAYLLLRS